MKLSKILILISILLISSYSYGMGRERFGPADKDRMSWSPHWIDGTKALLAHESRVYSAWVNGFERFYFDATSEQINELIDLFSKLQILDHEVWVESGPQTRNSFHNKAIEYNVYFYIPARVSIPSYFDLRADEDPKDGWTLPILRVYSDVEGELLRQLKLPDNVIVNSELPNYPKTNTNKSVRKPYVTRFILEDGTPASGIGFRTKITLWKKDEQQGYILGDVGFQGIFEMFFSDEEMIKLTSGDIWLTATYGNNTLKPKPTDQKITVECLTPHILMGEKKKEERPRSNNQEDLIDNFNSAYPHAKTFIVKNISSNEYYGRLVYKDKDSENVDPELISRNIMIVLPRQGMIELGREGYFEVLYSKEEIEQLIKNNSKGTVIIRLSDKAGDNQSTANVRFTLDILSMDKAKAGVIEIPMPDVGKY